uniref:(northern house mosquito) hypothetical protein n=1 Tax=Culex pipiens TaxID=7175 RepID=A0A8D8MU40_CULPI
MAASRASPLRQKTKGHARSCGSAAVSTAANQSTDPGEVVRVQKPPLVLPQARPAQISSHLPAGRTPARFLPRRRTHLWPRVRPHAALARGLAAPRQNHPPARVPLQGGHVQAAPRAHPAGAVRPLADGGVRAAGAARRQGSAQRVRQHRDLQGVHAAARGGPFEAAEHLADLSPVECGLRAHRGRVRSSRRWESPRV